MLHVGGELTNARANPSHTLLVNRPGFLEPLGKVLAEEQADVLREAVV